MCLELTTLKTDCWDAKVGLVIRTVEVYVKRFEFYWFVY